ncbi:hypothetical protein F7725_022395 [Dissostichus mawsoni]|uniref:Uncharacterized protein n=1 Tax=Dissostichus mawsoni TaxID=36200 RepID=A0A7J5YY06_DISMA|nr:hypothetical protein F7725_022395 [Dissostichus mawsoni]
MIAVGLKSAKSRLLAQVMRAPSRWKNGDTCCDHYMHKTAQIKSFIGTAVDQSLGLSLEVGAALESGVNEGTLKKVCEGAASRWKNGDTCCDYMHKTAQIKSFIGTAVDQSLGLSLEVGGCLGKREF